MAPSKNNYTTSRQATFLTADRANFIAEVVCFESCNELISCCHYDTASILVKPLYVERRPSQWRCLRCTHNPKSGIGLDNHMLTEHNVKLTFLCPFCFTERNSVREVAAHMKKRECNRTVSINPLTEDELNSPPIIPCQPALPLRPKVLEAIETLEESTFKRLARETFFSRLGSNHVSTLADHLTRLCQPIRPSRSRRRRNRRRSQQSQIQQAFKRNQWLWHRSKAKCFSSVMNGDTESSLALADADSFFRELFSESSPCNAELIRTKPAESINLTSYYIQQEEFEFYLSKKRRSAPGPDGLQSADLLKKAKEWTILINLCLLHSRIPTSWHSSRTTLIPKCNSNLPSDHRPISVSAMAYRALAAILSRRLLHSVNLHESQRGFIEDDGLHQAITTVRFLAAQHKPMVSIDLRKAFDSVPHDTLLNTSMASGLDLKSLRLIADIYTNATTTLQIGSQRSEPIPLQRGVRQGDPLSPVLFNLVIDQVVRIIDSLNLGVCMGNRKLAALAYADDIILCSESSEELITLTHAATEALSSLGLAINWSKSFSFGTTLNGLPSRSSFKYLGSWIDPTGDSRMENADLNELMAKLDRGVLRGNQKLYFLRFHLLPSIYHRLIHERATATVLREMTVTLRNFVRKWVRLPATTCSSFIHLAISNGGLGIPNLRWKIPELARSRMTKLQKCRAWYVQEIVKSSWYRNELFRVDSLCPMGSTEKWLLHDVSLANPGHMAFPIGGAKFANRHMTGSSYIEGKRFYRLAQLRSIADNKCTRQARPPLLCTKCNTGQPATLQHILCLCKDNEITIRRRHDKVLKEVIAHCKKKKWKTLVEPSLAGNLRPDLLVALPGEVLCLDVTIAFELTRQSLRNACNIKVAKYSHLANEIRSLMTDGALNPAIHANTQFYGLTFGARGSIAEQTLNVLQDKLQMPRWRIDRIISQILSLSLDLFEHSPLCTRLSPFSDSSTS